MAQKYKWIGIKFAEKFPVFPRGNVHQSGSEGPFYDANQVLSWWPDDTKHRAWLEASVQYWKERGYTPSIEERPS